MNRETYLKILSIQETAMNDPEYIELRKNYVPAQERFADLLFRLPEEDQEIVDDFLLCSIDLFHRLMVLAADTTLSEHTDTI